MHIWHIILYTCINVCVESCLMSFVCLCLLFTIHLLYLCSIVYTYLLCSSLYIVTHKHYNTYLIFLHQSLEIVSKECAWVHAKCCLLTGEYALAGCRTQDGEGWEASSYCPRVQSVARKVQPVYGSQACEWETGSSGRIAQDLAFQVHRKGRALRILHQGRWPEGTATH